MSGWDTPSRPTWGPQDGPEDSTQAFSAPDVSADADDRWAPPDADWGARRPDNQTGGFPRSGVSVGPPPEFFAPTYGAPLHGAPVQDHGAPVQDYGAPVQDYGAPVQDYGVPVQDYGVPVVREPGATLGDLPIRTAAGNGRGRQSGSGSYGQDTPYGQDNAYGLNGNGNGNGNGRGGGYGWDAAAGAGGGGVDPARDERPWQDAAPQGFGRQEFGDEDYGREDFGRRNSGDQDFGGQDFGRRNSGGQDFGGQERRRIDYSATADLGPQAPPVGGDRELAARMDPALQDFFAPAPPVRGPRTGPFRAGGGRGPQAALPPALPPGPDRQSPRRGSGLDSSWPGDPRGAWDESAGSQGATVTAKPAPRDLFAPRPERPDSRVAHRGGRSGGGRNRLILIGVVVVVVVGGGVYFLTHGSGGSNSPSASTGTTATTAPSKSADTGSKATSAAKAPGVTSGGYKLSTPQTAGGYPMGQDPHFLATTTATATSIEQAAVRGSGGTVTGSPVSASYMLPDEQTIEFVGYQGTFNPTTVMANLKSFGSDQNTYQAGPNGGDLACVNTAATATTASGAVCFWVTTSTLGVTEFFDVSGPEALTQSQDKGASDTVGLRSSVETKS